MHAKLAWPLQHSQEALRSWQRALPILAVRITHGPRHELVKQVMQSLAECEMGVAQCTWLDS
jgi:hypothetical protein